MTSLGKHAACQRGNQVIVDIVYGKVNMLAFTHDELKLRLIREWVRLWPH
jgi:hypothetical protein